jgi:uncharacterized phiE125 gp8 family phage protein
MRVYPITLPGTFPTAEPVTLEQLRAEVAQDDAIDDALLLGSLMAARDLVEGMAGRRLIQRSVRATFEAWPIDGTSLVIGAPVSSIDAIAYTDPTQTQVPWPAGQWVARVNDGVTSVRPAYNTSWPTLGNDPVITLDATTGYTQIPEAFAKAILLVAAHFYANREATAGHRYVPTEMALGVRALIAAHRWTWFG